nr:MAG TPA: hypothetical protein [Caudoviricetes sp.]
MELLIDGKKINIRDKNRNTFIIRSIYSNN